MTASTRPPSVAAATRRLADVKRMITTSSEINRPPGTSKEIDFEDHANGNRVFTLNRPKALNALSWDMFYTMQKKAEVGV